MTTRTRKATGSTPEKNTAAKKPARTRRNNPAKAPATNTAPPSLSLVKPAPSPQPAPDRNTLVDLRHRLPVRRQSATGPYTPQQLTEARACQASAMAALPIPHLLWLAQPDGRAAARLTDGTFIVHTAYRGPQFTAHIRCPHGAIHQHSVTSGRELAEARAVTKGCERQHATDKQNDAITRGVQRPTPAPKPAVVVQLREGVRRAKALHDDTEPLSLNDIAAGLEARTADTDDHQAKEDLQP
ncbi:hypothetical protein [Streptomyces sp. NPDC047868]|uniref:hypothetical protein n=1 Tax=Streptomyces sp. NPDC047868 TaxID=3155480 RepID=UPI00345316C2